MKQGGGSCARDFAVLCLRIVLLFVFVFSLFTASASLFLLCCAWVPGLQLAPMCFGLVLRCLLFCLLTGASLYAVLKIPGAFSPSETAPLPEAPLWWRGAGLAAVLAFAGLLAGPNLDDYPWAAPDEMHHLIVAKNLAFHGVYASGHSESGFRRFDPYDSVGAPAILPAACLLRCFGAALGPARCVSAAYFLGLCFLLYRLAKPVFGARAGIMGAALLPMAFSSIYLSRTLYGEVPALFYLVLSLLLWRRALNGEAKWTALLAGMAFGLAVLTKSIFILCVFPFCGAWVYDRVTRRQIRWRHVLLPALTTGGVLFFWSLIKTCLGDPSTEGFGATLGLYRHYLLFGLKPVAANLLSTVGAYPLAHAMLLAALLSALYPVFVGRYDPALVVLLLVSLFFAAWWVFFTPGQLPRYLWPSYAILALFSGAFLHRMEGYLKGGTLPGRCFAGIVMVLILLPYAAWTRGQAGELYMNKEMRDDRALADFIRRLPPQTRIRTEFFPLQNTLSFFTDRWIERADAEPPDKSGYDVNITRGGAQPVAGEFTVTVGRYRVQMKSDILSQQSEVETPKWKQR